MQPDAAEPFVCFVDQQFDRGQKALRVCCACRQKQSNALEASKPLRMCVRQRVTSDTFQ